MSVFSVYHNMGCISNGSPSTSEACDRFVTFACSSHLTLYDWWGFSLFCQVRLHNSKSGMVIYWCHIDILMSYRYIDIFKYRTRYDILFYISIYLRYHMLHRPLVVFINSYFFFINCYSGIQDSYYFISITWFFLLFLSPICTSVLSHLTSILTKNIFPFVPFSFTTFPFSESRPKI